MVKQFGQVLSGLPDLEFLQLIVLANILAAEVFPVPLGPQKIYACENEPLDIEFFSVSTTYFCPRISSNVFGRY